MIENKKAKLIVDITKNIIKQYIDVLEVFINKNICDPSVKENFSEYEIKVSKASNASFDVKRLLYNYENLFEREKKELSNASETANDDIEVTASILLAEKAFKEIGIPKRSIQPLICYCIIKDVLKNDKSKLVFSFDKLIRMHDIDHIYNNIGLYNVGNLVINGTLDPDIKSNKQNYYKQDAYLLLEADQIHDMVEKYFNNLSKEKNITVDDYIDICNSLRKIGGTSDFDEYDCNGFFNRHIDNKRTSIIYQYPKFLDKYSIPKVEITPEQKLEEIKNKMARLEQLNKEESKLESRLGEIQAEKKALEQEINGLKL